VTLLPTSVVRAAEVPDDRLVQVNDVHVHFRIRSGLFPAKRTTIRAVDGVTFSVRRGETLGLVGSSGSGKSTVAHLIMGMQRPTSGSVVVAGQDLSSIDSDARLALQRSRQIVMQDPFSSLDPRMKVRDIIAEPITLGRFGVSRSVRAKIDARVEELLALVGLPANRADLYPQQFSGGQRQRIAIARALAPRPDLLVLDEPTSALDVSVRAQILRLLKGLQKRLGLTYLVISHDLVTVAYLASTVAVMHAGRIVEMGPTRSLYEAPRHPATLELLASNPSASDSFLTQPLLVGATRIGPLPENACRFSGRCALRTHLGNPDRCLAEDPRLSPEPGGVLAACHFSGRLSELNGATTH
jgi:oligopeptide/dipeptide ABC transporter ATP-binding protein